MPIIKKHRPFHLHLDESIIFLTARIYGGFSYLADKDMKNYFYQLLEEKAKKYDIDLKARVVLNNHYHLLVKTKKGNLIPKLIKEIHGASAREIRKNLPGLVVNLSQVLVQEITPWDRRQDERLRRELDVIANFSSRSERRLKSATTENHRRMNSASTGGERKLKSASTESDGLAKFISRYKNRFKPQDYRRLKSAITKGRIIDPEILVILVSKNRPVWYQYVDHLIRDEGDYYIHLNYIHQNPVKHGLVKKMSSYRWSSIHKFVKEKGRDWIIDCFREYPIIDFEPVGIAD